MSSPLSFAELHFAHYTKHGQRMIARIMSYIPFANREALFSQVRKQQAGSRISCYTGNTSYMTYNIVHRVLAFIKPTCYTHSRAVPTASQLPSSKWIVCPHCHHLLAFPFHLPTYRLSNLAIFSRVARSGASLIAFVYCTSPSIICP